MTCKVGWLLTETQQDIEHGHKNCSASNAACVCQGSYLLLQQQCWQEPEIKYYSTGAWV